MSDLTTALHPATAPVPAHVPDDMVRPFDMFGDPLFEHDLHDGLARLAAEGRDLFYTPLNGGQWVMIGRDVIFEVATDTELFSSNPHNGGSTEPLQIPIHLDPPAHGVYRQVLNTMLSARQVSRFDPELRVFANTLIDAVIDDGAVDFAKAVAEPFPVLFLMKLMGFPLDRFAEFREWVLAGISEADADKRNAIWAKVMAMSAELIHAREAERQDDLISRLLDADIDGRPPSFDEMQAFCLLLFIAGLDTVVNALSLNVRHLARDQPLQARLRADPGLIPAAVEEILRRYSFAVPPRFITRDAQFHGAPLRKGDMVLLYYPAGGLDPRAFPDPERVDLARKASHLGFGVGPHRCAGAQLARIELKIMLEEWLKRVPTFALDPARNWSYHTGYVYSVDTLPLVWDAGQAQAA